MYFFLSQDEVEEDNADCKEPLKGRHMDRQKVDGDKLGIIKTTEKNMFVNLESLSQGSAIVTTMVASDLRKL